MEPGIPIAAIDGKTFRSVRVSGTVLRSIGKNFRRDGSTERGVMDSSWIAESEQLDRLREAIAKEGRDTQRLLEGAVHDLRSAERGIRTSAELFELGLSPDQVQDP